MYRNFRKFGKHKVRRTTFQNSTFWSFTPLFRNFFHARMITCLSDGSIGALRHSLVAAGFHLVVIVVNMSKWLMY